MRLSFRGGSDDASDAEVGAAQIIPGDAILIPAPHNPGQRSVRTSLDVYYPDAPLNVAFAKLPIDDAQKRHLSVIVDAMRTAATPERPAYDLTAREVRQIFKQFRRVDKDHDDALDAKELRVFMARVGMKLSADEAQALTSQLDVDGTGDVQFTELMRWYLARMQDFMALEVERLKHRSPARVFWEERMKIPKRYKIAMGWVAAWLMFAMFALFSVTFALNFGEERFNGIIMSWGFGIAQTFSAEEPVMIWMYMLIPALIDAAGRSEIGAQLLDSFLGTAVSNCVSTTFGFIQSLTGTD